MLHTSSDWTFEGSSTREMTHCYHDYPARMIPQVARKILEMFGDFADKKGLLFDPYSGSGTSLVEGTLRGFRVVGTDLNPLARLISQAKMSVPDMKTLDSFIEKFSMMGFHVHSSSDINAINGISRLEFWFKPQVVRDLSSIRDFMRSIGDDKARLFFQVAFSETVRDCSNTRRGEFKLLRHKEDKLAKFEPDVFGTMLKKLERNRFGLVDYVSAIERIEPPQVSICAFNTVEKIPSDKLEKDSVDIVVTSPPYGDSGTTVAYGQYSRLSAAWLELEEPDKIDKKLMGNGHLMKIPKFPSDELNAAVGKISQTDGKRAAEVAAFYSDLLASIANVSKVIKPQGFACYVVGNRRVKGIVLPTSCAIKDFFENNGFCHVGTFERAIPNKRMPSKNSPSNVVGMLEETMTKEHIVIMRRKENT